METKTRLLHLIERLGQLLRTEIRRTSADLGLSEVHLAILDYLNRCNRFSNTPNAVSEYLGITKGTISQSIKLLDDRGLVRKKPDRGDRRIVRLHLTARGRRMAESHRMTHWHEILKALPERETAQAARTLDRLLAELQRRNGYRTFQQCATCRHLIKEGTATFCGLTQQPLQATDLVKICMDHETASPRETTSGSTAE